MVNKVMLIGRVGKDPEVRIFDNGKMAKFSLATSENYKKKNGEKVENTEWHNITIFGNLVDVVEAYVKKGQQLYLEGKIHYGNYEDKSGEKKYFTEIRCDTLQMLSKPEEKPILGETRPPDEVDDLPFS